MAYCTPNEVISLTGAEDTAASIIEIIAQADREIDARLALVGITADSNDPAVHGASLNLSIAGIMTRHRIDGTMPGSINVGGLSMSDNLDAAIATHRKTALDLISAYIGQSTSSTKTYVLKVNR